MAPNDFVGIRNLLAELFIRSLDGDGARAWLDAAFINVSIRRRRNMIREGVIGKKAINPDALLLLLLRGFCGWAKMMAARPEKIQLVGKESKDTNKMRRACLPRLTPPKQLIKYHEEHQSSPGHLRFLRR